MEKELTDYIKKGKTQEECIGFIDGFKEAEENAKDLVELLLIGLKNVQQVNTIKEAKNLAKFYLIKSEKFRNV